MENLIDAGLNAPDYKATRAHLKLGQLYSQSDCFSKAYYHYHQALTDAPNPSGIHYRIALLLHGRGEWDLAANHYRAASSTHPSNSPKLYYNWGLLNHQLGRYSLAAACYYEAIGSRPDYLSAWLNLGSILQRWDNRKAINFYQKLVVRFPHSAVIQNNFAYALQQEKDFASALKYYKAALALDPGLYQAHSNLARLWWQQKDYLKATHHACQAASLKPTPQTLGHWAGLLLDQGDFSTAFYPLRASISLMSEYVEAYCRKSLATQQDNRLAQAQHSCAQFLLALQRPPAEQNITEAEQYLCEAYVQSGAIAYESQNFSRAEMLYHQALAIRPQASRDLHSKLASCLVQQGKVAAAIAIAPTESDLAPSAPPRKLTRAKPTKNTQCSVTCTACMGDLIAAFKPQKIAQNVYRIRFENCPNFVSPKPTLKHLDEGKAWVSPKKSDWAACHEVIITDCQDTIVPEVSRQYPWKLPNCPMEIDVSIDPKTHDALPKKFYGKVVLLSTLSGHIYYHWMVDLLPRLGILQQQGISLEEIDLFVVNSVSASFQKETLQHLGIPLNKVIESDLHPSIQAEKLIVPTFSGQLDWVSAGTIEFLRSNFLSTDIEENPKKKTDKIYPKRLYISREKARYRHLLNEAEVEDTLSFLGFTKINLESLSVAEQARYFAEAEVIVSPHGSGLTNLVFCTQKTIIIELFSPSYIRTDYWMISQFLELDHYYLLGRTIDCLPLRRLMHQSPLTEDIYIDISSLRSVLRVANLEQEN